MSKRTVSNRLKPVFCSRVYDGKLFLYFLYFCNCPPFPCISSNKVQLFLRKMYFIYWMNMILFLMQLALDYGQVFSLRRGSTRTVFISGYKMVKEAVVNQLDSFVDRPIVPLFHVVFKGLGEYVKAWMCGTVTVIYCIKTPLKQLN